MIRTPTVFVLGAGASAEYGLPLGSDLVQLIVDAVGETGVLRKPLSICGVLESKLEIFAEKLHRANLVSIDAFLEKNSPEFVGIGKLCIGLSILFREQDAKRKLLESPPSDHWLKYVWNIMRAETNAASFSENKVIFVTFNYDRLVEHYFDGVLTHAFHLQRMRRV